MFTDYYFPLLQGGIGKLEIGRKLKNALKVGYHDNNKEASEKLSEPKKKKVFLVLIKNIFIIRSKTWPKFNC
jgi:hypothetical protein